MDKADIYAKLFTPEGDLSGLTALDFQGGGAAESLLRETYAQFLAFSVKVTAFSRFELQGTGQGEAYFATVIQVVGFEILEELLERYQSIVDGVYREMEDPMRQVLFGDEKLGPVARNIVKMWFSGNWYQLPLAWSQKYGPKPKDVTFTVSPNAYVAGLLWTAIGAHPAGAKAQGYASWANPPCIPPIAR